MSGALVRVIVAHGEVNDSSAGVAGPVGAVIVAAVAVSVPSVAVNGAVRGVKGALPPVGGSRWEVSGSSVPVAVARVGVGVAWLPTQWTQQCKSTVR